MANNSSIDGWSTCLQATPPSYVKCFRKTHKTLSGKERKREGERKRMEELCTTLLAPPCSLLQRLSISRQAAKKAIVSEKATRAGGWQATWKLAQGRVPHTHTRTLTHTLTCKHQLKFPPYSARSCRSFLRFSAKNLNAYVICAAQSIFTHTHREHFAGKICAENKNDRPKVYQLPDINTYIG